jgi:hypothetical protein
VQSSPLLILYKHVHSTSEMLGDRIHAGAEIYRTLQSRCVHFTYSMLNARLSNTAVDLLDCRAEAEVGGWAWGFGQSCGKRRCAPALHGLAEPPSPSKDNRKYASPNPFSAAQAPLEKGLGDSGESRTEPMRYFYVRRPR